MGLKDILNKENFFEKYTETISIERVCENTRWLIRLRWIACIGLLFGVLLSKAFFNIDAETVFPPLFIGLMILFFNFLFYLRYSYLRKRRVDNSRGCIEKRLTFINIQILSDLIMLSAIVYYTGGITTPLMFFYIFHMVISSIMLSKLNAYFWALFTIIIESVVVYLEYTGKIKHQKFFFFIDGLGDSSGYFEFFVMVVFSITLLVTVYFATTIMRPIRKRQLDLTKIKNELLEKKKKLELKNIELEDMDKSKTEFLYRVEHELKAPIGAILSLLSVVSRGYNTVDEKRKREFLDRSIGRVKSMKEMVSDLLSLSRIEAKNFKLQIEDIDIDKLLHQIIDELAPYSKKKKIEILADIKKDIPLIKGDIDALSEIIRNLIHNAIKYSFEGSVYISLYIENENVVFSVKDTGIGISEDDLKKIFEEFYRTSNAKAFEEGTGLGLSLVKKLIEQHNGTIKILSEINKGTESIVRFPI